MKSLTAQHYPSVIAARIAAERLTLATRWLARLRDLLTVKADDVFPSDQLLDHIPMLVDQIAAYLAAPEDQEIAANASVMDKARELGQLRHQQRASAHQLLHEYEILGEILESFLVEETGRLALTPTIGECFEVQRRLTRSVRVLMRTTVDTFIGEYTTTIQDQSERIKAFNRAASHELRSPISTLLFAGALLDKDVVRQDQARLTKVSATVRASAERLSWLVENLQRLARMGDASDLPNQQLIDLRTLAEEVARQLADMAASRRVSIRVSPGLPRLIADPARIELVLLNLVANAVKYSDTEKVDAFVEIGLAGAQAPATDAGAVRTCTIAIGDNGIGIPEADQPAIFDRFFRAHAHLDGELGVTGTGLGLAIVIDCVQALGGNIRCESRPGIGTTFFVTLPLAEASAQSERA
ncbi:MAG TPA: HAMP domain-containing sensor histidine kinase [Vicinamibacterales bacterium]